MLFVIVKKSVNGLFYSYSYDELSLHDRSDEDTRQRALLLAHDDFGARTLTDREIPSHRVFL